MRDPGFLHREPTGAPGLQRTIRKGSCCAAPGMSRMLRRNVTQAVTPGSEKSEERTGRYRVIVPHWQVAVWRDRQWGVPTFYSRPP